MPKRFYAVLWIALTTLLLIGLYVGLHESFNEPPSSRLHSHTYRLSISEHRPGVQLPVFEAQQGDSITLAIGADRRGEVHVHGYEKNVVLSPGGEVSLTFTAQDSGLYPIHLHEPLGLHKPESPILHRHLATLEVQPR